MQTLARLSSETSVNAIEPTATVIKQLSKFHKEASFYLREFFTPGPHHRKENIAVYYTHTSRRLRRIVILSPLQTHYRIAFPLHITKRRPKYTQKQNRDILHVCPTSTLLYISYSVPLLNMKPRRK